MSKRKCRYCKRLAEISELKCYCREPKNRGDITEQKIGAPSVFYAHETCYEARQKEIKEKNNLYDYLVREYFIHFVPPLLLQDISKLRQNYSYGDLLDCLIQCQAKIKNCKASDTTHLCRLITYFLKQNIDDFVKSKLGSVSSVEDKVFQTVKRREEIEEPALDYDVL